MKKFILSVIPCCIFFVSCSNNQNVSKDDPRYILDQRRKAYTETQKDKVTTYQEKNEQLMNEIREKIN